MPDLTLRPDTPSRADRHLHIMHGNERVGTLLRRDHVPRHEDEWSWSWNLIRGGQPVWPPEGCQRGGNAESLEAAKAAFRAVWERWVSRTPATEPPA